MGVKITSYLSNSHRLYLLAVDACEKSSEEPAQALAAILLAFASAEGFINELQSICEMTSRLPAQVVADQVANLAELVGEVEECNGQIELKYHVAYLALTGKSFSRGSQPFQDFKLLSRLRNCIAHYKMDVQASGNPNYPKPLLTLIQRGIALDHPPGVVAPWLRMIESRDVAKWACNAVAGMVNAIDTAFPQIQHPFNKLMFGLGRFQPVD